MWEITLIVAMFLLAFTTIGVWILVMVMADIRDQGDSIFRLLDGRNRPMPIADPHEAPTLDMPINGVGAHRAGSPTTR